MTRLWFGREAGLCGPQVTAGGLWCNSMVRCLSSVREVLASFISTAEVVVGN